MSRKPRHGLAAVPAVVPVAERTPQVATTAPKLPSGWRLLRASWRDYRRHFSIILLVTGLVVLPVNLLSLIPGFNQDSGFAAYTTVASFFMNVALISVLLKLLAGDVAPRLRDAYYLGTARILAFILVSATLIAMLVPAAFALVLFSIGSTAPEGAAVSSGELALIASIAFILAVPSLWLMVRFVLAPFLAVAEMLNPLDALRRSHRLTRGQFWRLTGRYGVLVIAIFVIGIICVLPAYLLGLVFHSTPVLQLIFQTLLSFIALPIADLYILHLYRQLKKVE